MQYFPPHPNSVRFSDHFPGGFFKPKNCQCKNRHFEKRD